MRYTPHKGGLTLWAVRRTRNDRRFALTRIDEAQRLAGKRNQDANAVAANAAKTINDVLESPSTR